MSLPRYAEYRDSGIEWLGEVPAHWQLKRIRFAAELNPPKSEIATEDRAKEVSFLPMEAIGDDGSLALDRTRPIREVETGYTYFRDGDVTLAKITPCFENGKGALMRGLREGFGFGTTELIVARPRAGQITGSYLNWLFRSPNFRREGEASMYGAGGQKRVSDDFVRNFTWSFPPVEEQIAIEMFLDRETAKIDALIAVQEKLLALLAEKRQATISHAVTRGLDPGAPMKDSGIPWLGEVPANWVVRSMSSISTKITNGYVGPTRDVLVDEGIRYLQSLHIKGNTIRFDSPYYVRKEWSDAHRKSILEAGDVLIVQTGDIGQSAVVTEAFAGCNCHALIIVAPVRSELDGRWLSWVLNSGYGVHSLLSIQTGALHPHLNCGNVKGLYVPLPPLPEQKQIVEHIQNVIDRYEALIGNAKIAIALLSERRSALISAAVTGKIDVRSTA